MIEVVWKEADSDQLTRYKVLYPITTPMMPRPPHVTDSKYPNKLGCVYIRKFFAHWSLLHRYCAWGTGLWCAFGYLPSWCDADEHDLCHCCTDCCRSQCKRLQCPRETLPPWLQRLQSSSALLWLCGPEECMSTHFPQVFVKCFLFSCPCPPPSIKALILYCRILIGSSRPTPFLWALAWLSYLSNPHSLIQLCWKQHFMTLVW